MEGPVDRRTQLSYDELVKENLELKEKNKQLELKSLVKGQKIQETNYSKEVITTPIKGNLQPKDILYDVSICYFDETGYMSAAAIEKGLAAFVKNTTEVEENTPQQGVIVAGDEEEDLPYDIDIGREMEDEKRKQERIAPILDPSFKVTLVSYGAQLIDTISIETKIASSKSLILVITTNSLLYSGAIFAIQAAQYYNCPIIVVHDLGSCMFPNPSSLPKQIQESGIFNSKAVTFIAQYERASCQQIVNQIVKAAQKTQFCFCFAADVPPSVRLDFNAELPHVKYSQLLLTDKEDENYKHLINLEILRCRYQFMELVNACSRYSVRVYFVYPEDQRSSLLKKLQPLLNEVNITNALQNYLDGYNLLSITPFTWIDSGMRFDVSSFKAIGEEFDTILFKFGANRGRWYYEVSIERLEGNGVFGWATSQTNITSPGGGLGDDTHSFGYDGELQKIWNDNQSQNYGQQWHIGDIIGCAIDLDKQEMTFTQNGINLGVAYSNFVTYDDKGEPNIFYPGISIDGGSESIINLGNIPFSYFDEWKAKGYLPIMETMTVITIPFSPQKIEQSIQSITEVEAYYKNYSVEVPRTRAFLSHKRSSAQGTAGRIWQELKNDYKVFLDSEAQFDLHDLKLIVKTTGLFIFILSEGIFDSYWCMEELRSAIQNKRKILILQDYQFQIPTLPPHLKDIQDIIEKSDRLIYIAEYFSECIKQIRSRLGLTDNEIKERLSVFGDEEHLTCIKNDAFTWKKAVMLYNVDIKKTYSIVKRYFECSSFSKIGSLTLLPKKPFNDSDIKFLAEHFPNLKLLNLEASHQVSNDMWVYLSEKCQMLEDFTFKSLALNDDTFKKMIDRLPNLRKIIIAYTSDPLPLSNEGIRYFLQKRKVLQLYAYGSFTDKCMEYLPKEMVFFGLTSDDITDDGIRTLAERCPRLASFTSLSSKVTEESLPILLHHCKQLNRLEFRGTAVSSKYANLISPVMRVLIFYDSLSTIQQSDLPETCCLQIVQ